jgi:pyrroline-5-carboxylate reductase
MVRAMPNTPAEVGRGITALVADPKARADARNRAEILMRAVGEIAWVDGEDAINATTAISGSGPAYVFLLVEALAKAALVQGLPPAQAAQCARATIHGAGRLLEQSADSPTALREAVTSPGGTTAAALGVLMATDTGLEPLVMRAVHEAVMRARALAG